MNKQLSLINYKLQNNLRDLGRDFYARDEDEAIELDAGRRRGRR
jgi:hypothetical protein